MTAGPRGVSVGPKIPGLVWGYRFAAGGTAEPVADSAPLDALLAPDILLWLHLNGRDSRLPAVLARLDELSEPARASLLDRDEHLRITAEPAAVYGVFPDFELNFEGESWSIARFHFALTERLLVTVRRHPLYSPDRTRQEMARGPMLSAPIDVLEMIVEAFHDRLTVQLSRIGDEIDDIEDGVFDDVPRDERKRLGPMRRTLVRLHRHLRGAAGLLRRLQGQAAGSLPAGVAEAAERMGDRLATTDLDVLALQERARLLHEEIDSKVTAETNRHLFTLSVLSALLLPPTLIVGFFGMNTADMPFQESHGGTWLAGLLCVGAIGVAWWFLRRGGIGPR